MLEERSRFLEHLHLPSDTSEYEYSGFSHAEQAADQAYRRFITDGTRSPFVIFTNLPLEEFEKHEDNFSGRVDYSPNLQLLILSMVSFPHEVAAGIFSRLVDEKTTESGILDTLLPRLSTLTVTPDRWKQADLSWIPSERPPGRSTQWPSVTVEVGYSEPRGKLKSDMEFWLNKSNDVQMALSIDIKRPSGNIFITTWERETQIPPRTPAKPKPKAIQEIKIERGKIGQQPNITGDNNLTIPFRSIMLRNSRQGEGDFIFTRQDLLRVANAVWIAMDDK